MMLFDRDVEDFTLHTMLELQHCEISHEQMRKFEGYMAEIFDALGMDLNMPATEETPQRFVRAMFDATEGYDSDPKLLKVFETECRGGSDCSLSQIIEGPIPFFALSEHHALPFFGLASIGYIAHKHIIGISKLTRLFRRFAKHFTVQERLGRQIADIFTAMLEPHGVAVYVEAHHLCMQMRGVKETASLTHTTAWRGEYERNSSLWVEFLLGCGADV
jgi:GTP cyclohydrolase IA